MAEVLMVGSVALDTVETPYGRVEYALGGAAVFAAAAASQFAGVQIVGVVGDDFTDEHMGFLTQLGVDTQGIERVPGGKTFHWEGFYSQDMNSRTTVTTELNVFERFEPKLPPAYQHTEYLFLANIDPTLQIDVLAQAKGAKFVGLDTMNLWIDTSRDELLKVVNQVQAIFLNDEEARMLTGQANLVTAGRSLLELGPRVAIVKKGEHGALMFTEQGVFCAPGFPLETTPDPTGCGDCFAGGFMGYLASVDDTSELALRRAVIYGSDVASYNAEGFGVERLRTLTHDEVEARYAQFQDLVRF